MTQHLKTIKQCDNCNKLPWFSQQLITLHYIPSRLQGNVKCCSFPAVPPTFWIWGSFYRTFLCGKCRIIFHKSRSWFVFGRAPFNFSEKPWTHFITTNVTTKPVWLLVCIFRCVLHFDRATVRVSFVFCSDPSTVRPSMDKGVIQSI